MPLPRLRLAQRRKAYFLALSIGGRFVLAAPFLRVYGRLLSVVLPFSAPRPGWVTFLSGALDSGSIYPTLVPDLWSREASERPSVSTSSSNDLKGT